MSLNTEKLKSMIIGHKRQSHPKSCLSGFRRDAAKIIRVHEVNCFGIRRESTFQWTAQDKSSKVKAKVDCLPPVHQRIANRR